MTKEKEKCAYNSLTFHCSVFKPAELGSYPDFLFLFYSYFVLSQDFRFSLFSGEQIVHLWESFLHLNEAQHFHCSLVTDQPQALFFGKDEYSIFPLSQHADQRKHFLIISVITDFAVDSLKHSEPHNHKPDTEAQKEKPIIREDSRSSASHKHGIWDGITIAKQPFLVTMTLNSDLQNRRCQS